MCQRVRRVGVLVQDVRVGDLGVQPLGDADVRLWRVERRLSGRTNDLRTQCLQYPVQHTQHHHATPTFRSDARAGVHGWGQMVARGHTQCSVQPVRQHRTFSTSTFSCDIFSGSVMIMR